MVFRFWGSSIVKPVVLQRFLDGTDALVWNSAESITSLKALFSRLNALAQEQTIYYYNQRKSHLDASMALRLLAWFFGTVGLLMPLLANACPAYEDLSKWGYALLALSASLMAANSLFGSSSGHARSVIAQIELEKLVAVSTINWHQVLAEAEEKPSPKVLRDGFTLMSSFAQGIYKIMGDETMQWSQETANAISNYEKQAKAGRN